MIDKTPVLTEEPATLETTIVGVIDTIKGSFLELVAFAKSVGPDVWEIMIRQQFAAAASISIGLALVLIAAVFSYRVIAKRPSWALDGNEDNLIGWVMAIVSTVGSVVMTGIFLTAALPRFINPAYYVLKELVKLKS